MATWQMPHPLCVFILALVTTTGGAAESRPTLWKEYASGVDGSKQERTTMMRRAIFLVVLGMSTLALVVGAALATPPKGATTTVLTRATFGTFANQNSGIKVKSKRDADLAIAKQVIEPGGSSGWHHHPAVSFIPPSLSFW